MGEDGWGEWRGWGGRGCGAPFRRSNDCALKIISDYRNDN